MRIQLKKEVHVLSKTIIPTNYESVLNVYDTQTAIGFIKRCFEEALTGSLKLKRVSAPLFVHQQSGLNDNLSGVERPVQFDVPSLKIMVKLYIPLLNGSAWH